MNSYACECTDARLTEPRRVYYRNLTEQTIRAGHWVARRLMRGPAQSGLATAAIIAKTLTVTM